MSIKPSRPSLPLPRSGDIRGKGITRETILDCAAEVFAERGYQAANLMHVASQLGVTRQALYYHFGRKQDILEALFHRMMDVLEAGVDKILASDPPAATLFSLLIRNHSEVVAANINLVATLLTERTAFESVAFIEAQERRRRYTDRLVRAYARGVEVGVLRDLDPRTTVNLLIGAQNAMYRWFRETGSISPDTIAMMATDLFRNGFAEVEIAL